MVIWTMQKRDYDSRSKRLLGYYSTEDTVHTVNLDEAASVLQTHQLCKQ